MDYWQLDQVKDSNFRLREFDQLWEKRRSSIQHDGFKPLDHVGRIALVCIAKDEDRYIDEWIDYHLKLGVDEVFVYENDWRSNLRRERVRTIPFDGERKQVPAYNHFLYTQSAWLDWAIFIDVDEFVCLKKHSTIREFLREYGNIPEKVDAIAANWMSFGDNNQQQTEGSVLERFTRRGKYPERHVKLIVRLNDHRVMLGPHHSYGYWIDTNGRIGGGQNNFNGTCDVIQINHYFCKTWQEYGDKMNRGRADWFSKRTKEDFDLYNRNDVEDLTALNFYRN